MKKLLVVAIGLVAVFLAGCGAARSTPEPDHSVADYVIWADDFAGRWDDAMAVANVTGRGNLASPVAELQALKREAAAYQSNNTDVMVAHVFLVDATGQAVDGFLAFMSKARDSVVDSHFSAYERGIEEWAARYIVLGN